MKKLLIPMVAVAMLSMAACGGSDERAKTPVADQPKTALTQVDLAPRVQAALLKSGTFHSVTKTTDDEDDPATYTADLKVAPGGGEVSADGSDGNSLLRVDGVLYAKGTDLTDDPAKPWLKWDPKAASDESSDPVVGMELELLSAQVLTHEYLGAVAYATKFRSAPGETVDGARTTQYTITIDPAKAAAAKAFGEYLDPGAVVDEKLKEITAVLLVDQDSLPRKLEFTFGGSKMSTVYTEFGKQVTITAPPAGQIDG
ncbi:hypothetical protein GCM10009554_63230 [Kribbella koreensis]|uniref:Lipoprotein LprG n=1 Tax=Kribbella koreensis TaxID=57909 RepID=A0ABP4BVT1_9ACTN